MKPTLPFVLAAAALAAGPWLLSAPDRVLASIPDRALAPPEHPLAAGPFVEPDAVALITLTGETPTDQFGWVGERLADLDGDGAADFIVGAPSSAAGGTNAGRAYVYSGRTGALLNVVTGRPGERLGFSVAGIPDADGDGVGDYAVGGPGLPGVTALHGRVTLYSGATHAVLQEWSGDGDSFFGADVNSAGDVDGDGRGDVIVGAPRTSRSGRLAGRVVVLSGRSGATLWTIDGQVAGDLLGTAVSGLGDLDGDGVPEQGAGARNAGPQAGGLAYIINGRTGQIAKTLHPTGTAVDFGWFFVHDAGDADGDGISDIYVGDFNDGWKGAFSGRGYLISGASGERIRTMNAEAAGDGFGVGRGVGDVDGDGRADLFLAAYTSSAGAPGGGRAYLISGRNGQTLRTITGAVANASLGVDAVGLGDVNGDGLPDYLLTTFNAAYVVAGTPLAAH